MTFQSPSDAIILAVLASFTTLGGQILSQIFRIRDRKKDAESRAKVAEKLEETKELLNEKLDVNTELTLNASTKAANAFNEANHFNQRLIQIETELKQVVETELLRLSNNIHAIANALTPLVGKIGLQSRQGEGGE